MNKDAVLAKLYNLDHKIAPGGRIRFSCLFCSDTRHRCYYNPDIAWFFCHNCGKKGSFFQLWEKLKTKSDLWYAKKVEKVVSKKQQHAAPIFIPITQAPIIAQNYLYSRLPYEKCVQYKVEYCKDHPYKDRIIFPVYINNRRVYFQARCVADFGFPRYINPKKEDILLGKSEVVFNLDAIPKTGTCVIFEGWLNAVSINTNGVAIFGKYASEIQIELLLSKQCSEYIVFLDLDAKNLSLTLAETLLKRGATCVKIALHDDDANADPIGAELAIRNSVKVTLNDILQIKLSGGL